jgi:hypothetical protein
MNSLGTRSRYFLFGILGLLMFSAHPIFVAAYDKTIFFPGANLSGGDFGGENLDGVI